MKTPEQEADEKWAAYVEQRTADTIKRYTEQYAEFCRNIRYGTKKAAPTSHNPTETR